jgi:hypothetical protein
VNAAIYWEMVYDEVVPTKLLADILLAPLHKIKATIVALSEEE